MAKTLVGPFQVSDKEAARIKNKIKRKRLRETAKKYPTQPGVQKYLPKPKPETQATRTKNLTKVQTGTRQIDKKGGTEPSQQHAYNVKRRQAEAAVAVALSKTKKNLDQDNSPVDIAKKVGGKAAETIKDIGTATGDVGKYLYRNSNVGRAQRGEVTTAGLSDAVSLKNAYHVGKGAGTAYYKKPALVAKDAEAVGDMVKGMLHPEVLLKPRKLVETIKADYKERYKGSGKELERNVKNYTTEHGGLSYGLDAIPVATVAGKGAGALAKATLPIATGVPGKFGRVAAKAERGLTAPRPLLRTGGNVVRKQRRDQSRKAAPNVARQVVERGIDRARRKRFERHDRRGIQESIRTGTNARPALRPNKGEVLPYFKTSARLAQARDVAKSKAKNRLRQIQDQSENTHAAEKAIRPVTGRYGFSKLEESALSMVYEGIVPNDPRAARKFLEKRRKDIAKERMDSDRKPPTRFESDELADINRLLENLDKAFTPKVTTAADELRRIDRKASKDNPALPADRRLRTRYGPQAAILGVKEKPRQTVLFDEKASRKAAERRGINFEQAARSRLAEDTLTPGSKTAGVVERTEKGTEYARRVIERRDRPVVHTTKTTRFPLPFQVAFKKGDLPPGDARRTESLKRTAEKGSGATDSERSTAAKMIERIAAKKRPVTREVQGGGEYQRTTRTTTHGKPTGLQAPGYLPHATKAGDTNFANYAIGGVTATDYAKRTMSNFREGRVDRRTSTIVQGVARTTKVKHQWRLVTEVAQRHRLPKYSGRPLTEAVEALNADGVNPAEVGIYFPRKAKQYAREAQDGVLETVETSEGVHQAFMESSSLPKNKRDLEMLVNKYGNEEAVVMPKAAYDEIMSTTKPSGGLGRGLDVVNTKLSRAVLGFNLPWVAVDAISGASANALMNHQVPLGPDFWKSQKWHINLGKTLQQTIDPELGLSSGGRREWLLHQPKMGSTANGYMAKQWRAWRETPIGRVRPIGAPLDAFMKLEQKGAVDPFRKQAAYKFAKKAVYDDLTQSIGVLNASLERAKWLFTMGPEEQIKKLLEDPAVVSDIARSVDDALGEWISRTAVERTKIARVTFFYPYMRYSLRTVFYTMPAEHPLVSSILGQLSRMKANEVREMLGGELPWNLGRIYYKGKNGQLMQFDLLKRANFLTNAVTGADASNQLLGSLSPVFQLAANQIIKQNTFAGRGWQVTGKASTDAYNDLPLEKQLEVRARIFARDVLNLAFPLRIANKVASSGAKEGDDSLPFSRRYLKYVRSDKLADQQNRINQKNKYGTLEQAGQAMGFLPQPSYDKELIESRNPAKKGGFNPGGGALIPGGKSGGGFNPGGVPIKPALTLPKTTTSQVKTTTPAVKTASVAKKPRLVAKAKPSASPARGRLATSSVTTRKISTASVSSPAPTTASVSSSSAPIAVASSGKHQRTARDAAERHGIDPDIFERQIQQESGFKTGRSSSAGAQGIAQIMPATAKAWGVDPNDPVAALDAAAKHMAIYVKKYGGSYEKALAAYNAGEGAVAKYGGVPPFAETKNYVAKIMNGQSPVAATKTTKSLTVANPVDPAGARLAILQVIGNSPGGRINANALASALVATPTVTKSADKTTATTAGGKLSVAAGANRAGVGLSPAAKDFAKTMSGYYGSPVVVTTGTNHNRMTTSGNVSDHWDGNGMDFGIGTDMAKGDRIAAAALEAAGYSPAKAKAAARKGGVFNLTHNGKRIQIIWRSNVGGNHYDHTHVGVKPL